MGQLSMSLPMVLHNLRKVIDLTLQCYKTCDKSCRLIILEGFHHLVKDCRDEFHPYLFLILKELFQYVNIEKVDLFEAYFIMLAYCVRYLEKLLIADFSKFISEFIGLYFIHPSKSIREVSSQVLGYLIKKYQKKKLITKVIETSVENKFTS